MGLFGQSKDEVWRQLAQEIHADFVEGGFWRGSKVQAHVGPWIVTLDTYIVSDGHSSHTYTQMRAPYVNPDGFRFTIHRKGFLSELGKLFGMQDIEVGDAEFDEAFIIKGNDEGKVRELFADAKLRALISAQRTLRLEVKDDEGLFRPHFPHDVDELLFRTYGMIKELDRLKGLFDLFAEALERLCRMGSAYKVDPGVNL